ncbi:hypothetical protein GCM10025781_18420 [Kocuria gwangalliensis]|uniref:DUF4352 domain-containing protein n=1 Tax=Kocuria gwangalliensis TaxID=501592 RepID=A0ABP8X4A3_9MICC
MKKFTPALGIALLAVAMAGCSAAEVEPEPTAPSVDPATASSSKNSGTEDSVTKSARGNAIKKIGEPAGVSEATDSENKLVNFAVQNIEVDPACTGPYPQPSENGHLVAVQIAAETGSSESFEKLYYGTDYSFNSHNWEFITPKGTTANNIATVATYSCLPENEMLLDTIGPSEKVTGMVVLDVPAPTGTLVFNDVMSDSSWEWNMTSK